MAWVRLGRPAAGVDELVREVEESEVELQAFETFVNMNYLAFSKILKKHGAPRYIYLHLSFYIYIYI